MRLWEQLDLDPTRTPLVEDFVSLYHFRDGLLLGENLRRVEGTACDEADELRDVAPVVAVAALHREVALLEHTDGEGHGRGREDPDNAYGPGLAHGFGRPRRRLRSRGRSRYRRSAPAPPRPDPPRRSSRPRRPAPWPSPDGPPDCPRRKPGSRPS